MLRFCRSSMHSNSTFTSICHSMFLFLLLWLFGSSCLEVIKPCSCAKDLNVVKCMKIEREALLTFKEGFRDPSGKLSSWVGEDCCKWRGVGCDNKTGHIFELNLKNPFETSQSFFFSPTESELAAYKQSCLGGKINPSLLRLKYLKYLDLSLNDFRGTHIPKFLGSLHHLRYLNLSFASFSGEIPPHLGNLSYLRYLDLNGHKYSFDIGKLHAENLRWLSSLSSLKHLNMGFVNLSRVGTEWLEAVNMLPSLVELHLRPCQLQSHPLSLPLVNFTSLSVLDISNNVFDSPIPHWLFNLTSLKKLVLRSNSFHGVIPGEIVNLIFLEELDLSSNSYIDGQLPKFLGNLCKLKALDLSYNNFGGEINEFLGGFSSCPYNSLVSLDLSHNQLVGNLPDSLGRLENLRYLHLFSNSFWGSIPTSIGSLSSLQELDLSFNKMNGTIPESIGQLSELVSLSLDSNSWEGVLTESHFLNLTRLEKLSVGLRTPPKSLSFNMSYGWIPPFSLKSIHLEYCQVGPKFPVWLQSQGELRGITLINVGISDNIPGDWISKLSSQITYLDLSNNQITGELPPVVRFAKEANIVLSTNFIEGPLPLWFGNLTGLSLEENLFSGPMPPNLGELMPKLRTLHLSGNFLNGSIPPSIIKLKFLDMFEIRDNQLSGALPDIWNDFHNIRVLDLANNNFSGNIPKSMSNLHQLGFLILSDNHLEGELPSSLQNCKSLISLDLGGNNLSGPIPLWIGDKLSQLMMLRLRSNLFSGELPPQLCHLSFLHILDLAHNNFTGFIPNCLGNLTALVYGNSTFSSIPYIGKMMIVAKGRELEYGKTLRYVNSIDLSKNQLMGRIPDQITSLSALGILNLSTNHLTGSIPEKIGNLRGLETLDLSNNRLSGPIPQSISSLNFLAHFNLSYNNLAGRIPSGNQLQTLNGLSIYEGNPSLCGVPLPTKCLGDDASKGDDGIEDNDDDEKDSEMLWFYVSIGPGFVVGFWGVCGTLLVKKTWRHAYFQFVDDIRGWIALMIALKVAGLRRKMELEHN